MILKIRLIFFSILLVLFFNNHSVIAQLLISDPTYFYNASLEQEKHRLDNYASELKSQPRKNIVLIFHNKIGRNKSFATQRLRQCRFYLMKKHKISAERILMVNSGDKQPSFFMEIFLVDSESDKVSLGQE